MEKLLVSTGQILLGSWLSFSLPQGEKPISVSNPPCLSCWCSACQPPSPNPHPSATLGNDPVDLLWAPIAWPIGLQHLALGSEREKEGTETHVLCGFKIQSFLKQLARKYSEMIEIRSPTQAANRGAAKKSHSKWRYAFKRERMFPLIALCFS